MCLAQTDIGPGSAAVSRLVHTIAFSLLTRSDVDYLRIRRRERQRSNRSHVRIVKDWLPHAAAAGRLPDTTARRTHVIDRRASGNAGDRGYATGAMRSDRTPLQ